MLSDEEKQAIDIIKNEIKAFEIIITSMKKEIDDKDWLRKNILEIKEDILVRKIVLNLIEKQSKEIEELKEDKYGLEEEVQIQAKNLMLCEDALREMQDKIKAKIEYYEKIDNPVGKRVLQSLLEKE